MNGNVFFEVAAVLFRWAGLYGFDVGGFVARLVALLRGLFVVVLVTGCLGGCATRATTEFVDADGTYFKAVSKAGIFAELNTDNQQAAYTWAGDGSGNFGVGQAGIAADNSGQVRALEVGTQSFAAMAELALTVLGAPPVEDGPAFNVWLEGLKLLTGGNQGMFTGLLQWFLGGN